MSPKTSDPPVPWPDAPRLAPWLELPSRPFVPGRDPHPRRDPQGSLATAPEPGPGLPADRWEEDRSYLAAVDLYHSGFLWEAHEFWEAGWHHAADPTHRALLQALIQLAAALLNAHLGKSEGVRRLVERVDEHLHAVAAAVPEGARLAGLCPRALRADVRRHFRGVFDHGDPLGRTPAVPRLHLERPETG